MTTHRIAIRTEILVNIKALLKCLESNNIPAIAGSIICPNAYKAASVPIDEIFLFYNSVC